MRRIGSIVGSLGEGLLEVLWPTRCVGCDAPGSLLCDACRASLMPIDQKTACPRCGAPCGSLVCTECNPCLELAGEEDGTGAGPRPGPESLLSVLGPLEGIRSYGMLEWPLDRMVRAYKDAGERRLSEELGAMVAQAVQQGYGSELESVSSIAFVPCVPEAYARRGFDHMGDVAAAVSRVLGIPLDDVLARRSRKDQRGLSRAARAENAMGSFAVLRPLDGQAVLLLDDVFTTGATLGAAARALQARGCSHVIAATVARAWQ